jgi:hypothetical protein
MSELYPSSCLSFRIRPFGDCILSPSSDGTPQGKL